MATRLEDLAEEEGTYVINLAWLDEDDNPVTPTTMAWDLVDGLGNEINGRTNVPITGLSTSNDIPLSGNDLAIPDSIDVDVDRYLRYYGTYISTLGTLPLTGEIVFTIENHKAKA